jgi:coenzyme F420-0:L-glutamate ligase/coenzyme F420-1:gamma-L-glutamate ligase
MLHQITLTAVPGIPLIHEGDDLGALIVQGLTPTGLTLADGDIVVVAQKVVSKAEGRVRHLADIVPTPAAEELAQRTAKDPRMVQAILDETREIVRVSQGVLIVEQRNGLICANAGVDRSNGDGGESIVLLPLDPDLSARRLRDRLVELTGAKIAVIINDSHGRPWRDGASGVAIGIAGIAPLDDRRGEYDLFGYELQHTIVALADQVAAAASLLQGQGNEGRPAVVVRGVEFVAREANATEVLRAKERDLFR